MAIGVHGPGAGVSDDLAARHDCQRGQLPRRFTGCVSPRASMTKPWPDVPARSRPPSKRPPAARPLATDDAVRAHPRPHRRRRALGLRPQRKSKRDRHRAVPHQPQHAARAHRDHRPAMAAVVSAYGHTSDTCLAAMIIRTELNAVANAVAMQPKPTSGRRPRCRACRAVRWTHRAHGRQSPLPSLDVDGRVDDPYRAPVLFQAFYGARRGVGVSAPPSSPFVSRHHAAAPLQRLRLPLPSPVGRTSCTMPIPSLIPPTASSSLREIHPSDLNYTAR